MDTHVHTNLSFDGFNSPGAMVEAALLKGLSYVAFTDHCDFDCEISGFKESGQRINEADWGETLSRIQEEYRGKIYIAKGIELGFLKAAVQECAGFLSRNQTDIVINSVHLVADDNPYTQGFFERRSKEEAYTAYLKAVRASLDVPYHYDVVAHTGYVTRKAPYTNKELTYTFAPDLWDDVLQTIIKKEKALEVNTNDKDFDFEPSRDVLKRYFELGGRLITLGSDAHTAGRIAEKFDLAKDFLKSVGFKEVFVYKNHVPEGIGI